MPTWNAANMRKTIKDAKKEAREFKALFTRVRYRYAWYFRNTSVHDKTILFESFHGKTISDSPFYMLREFLNDPRSADFTIYYSTKTGSIDEHREFLAACGIDNVRLVPVDTKRYAYVLATAKYLVNNSSFPAYFERRPEQRYIQTWHGTPLKTLGKKMRLGVESMYNVQHNFLHATMITFPNEFTRDILMRDYNLENLYTGKTALLGYPRNQVFFDENKREEVRRRYGLDQFESFAYMPTWRGSNNYSVDIENYRDQTKAFLKKLDAAMADNQRIYVNFHSMVAAQIGSIEFEHVKPFPADSDNYEFLNAVDALITDYSSVFFDYSITRRPIVLFTYDKQEYLADRGMYFDVDDLPFPQAATIDELCKAVSNGAQSWPSYEGTDYERKFLAYDTPENARKALALLFDEEASGVEVCDFSSNSQKQWEVVEPCLQNTLSEVATTCEAATPGKDIVVFLRSKFNEDKSKLLHDEYPTMNDFVFRTKAYNCSWYDEYQARHDKAALNALEERDVQRILPNISIGKEIVTQAYVGGMGTAYVYEEEDLPRISAKVGWSGDGSMVLRCKADDHELKRVVITRGTEIASVADISPEECETGKLQASIAEAISECYFRSQEVLRILIEVADPETGRPVPHAVAVKASGKSFGDDTLARTFRPISTSRYEAKEPLVLSPFMDPNNTLCFQGKTARDAIYDFKSVILDELSNENGKVHISCRLRSGDFMLESVILRYRSTTDDTEIGLPYDCRVEDGWYIIESVFDPKDIPLREVYWDAFAVIRFLGVRCEARIRLSSLQCLKLKLGNQQWRLDNGKVLFTHIAKKDGLSFGFRDYYPDLDTYAFRAKELAAFAVFAVLHPYWKRKRVWLVFEKYCSLAQDNGFYFFEYCMSLPEEQREHIFYVIDKSKPDYENVRPYDSQVLDYMSFKHILYTMVANLYIASDSKTHLWVWRNKPSFVRTRISKHKIFFLQHGVTALKRVAYLFGRKGSSPMTYFLTTSQKEQDIVVGNFGYQMNRAPILGFSRWDVLEDKSTREKPQILLMPTWRPWLEEQDDEVFVTSEYFKQYSSLIRNPRLLSILEEHDAKLRFFIHPKLSEQLGNFEADGGRIELVPQGSEPLNEVMMESNMLITDYSSVCWDMLYMDKPVVFYQFDQELYEKVIGSYVDLSNDLPGDVCLEEEAVVDAVAACIDREFSIAPEHEQKLSGWFANKDRLNRQRTYNFIVDQGF